MKNDNHYSQMNITEIVNNISAVLIVTIEGNKFCFDIQNLYTIIFPEEAVINKKINDRYFIEIRNYSIPIVDLKAIFKLKENEDGINSRIIILDINNEKFGFFVDSIDEIINISEKNTDRIEIITEANSDMYSMNLLIYGNIYKYPDFEKILDAIEDEDKISSE